MKPLPLVFLTAGLVAVSALTASTENFDAAPPGTLPANWLGTKTGPGTPKWAVEKDPTAPGGGQVLVQSGAASYPVCLRTDTKIKDGFVEVKFKAVAGREDQAGGVVWRAQDADNYFIARANALEDNLRLYRTVGGRRIQFDGVDLKVTGKTWHTLRVEFRGPLFTVFFDGQKVMTAHDGTFTAAGMTGVWTKADSVTAFDRFSCGAD
ncbi:MAG: hypothetical protein HY302_12840 [Opitutae bacterium]|nr:hypothetical protein [Opitutae bacterium]